MKHIKLPELIFGIITIATVVFILSYTPANTKAETNIVGESSYEDTSWHELLRKEMSMLLDRKHTFGFNGGILVGINDKIIFEGLKGFECQASKDSLNLNTRFQLASVSKQFTAVAILQLYENGHLDLNDTITKFFPEFPYKKITIHQLLTHRSGLSNYIYFLDKLVKDKNQPYTNDQVINLWKNHHPLPYYQPGKRFDYSNSGYMILASIVEKVTKTPFPEYMHTHVFEPLGMNNSFVYVAGKSDTLKHLAKGYNYHWRVATEPYLNATYGDKGVYSTLSDIFKWDQGLYTGKIVNIDTLAKAFEPMGKPTTYKHNYGYGWRIMKYNDEKILYHAGWWQGFKSLLIRVPEHKLTIVVLKNIKTGAMFGRNELLRRILDKYILSPTRFEALIPPGEQKCYKPDPFV